MKQTVEEVKLHAHFPVKRRHKHSLFLTIVRTEHYSETIGKLPQRSKLLTTVCAAVAGVEHRAIGSLLRLPQHHVELAGALQPLLEAVEGVRDVRQELRYDQRGGRLLSLIGIVQPLQRLLVSYLRLFVRGCGVCTGLAHFCRSPR